MTAIDANALYTPEEARKPLRLGRSSMYERLRTGEVKSVHLWRKVFVQGKEIARFLGSVADDRVDS